MPKILRTLNTYDELIECPREYSFRDLYHVVTDSQLLEEQKRMIQEEIRSASPKDQHCQFLINHSPDACLNFPIEVEPTEWGPGARKGQPCPNNPYEMESNKRLIRSVEKWVDWAEEAYDIVATIDLGMQPSIREVTAEEFAMARAVNAFRNRLSSEEAKRTSRDIEKRRQGGGEEE